MKKIVLRSFHLKKIFTICALLFLSKNVLAQVDATDKVRNQFNPQSKTEDTGWATNGILKIGLNQGMLQNWSAGGEQLSLAANGIFNGFATKTVDNTLWENTLDMFYGLSYVASNNFVPRKIDDRIDFSTRYGVTPRAWMADSTLKNVYFMSLARLQTQFSKGFNYDTDEWRTINNGQGISDFLSPLYATLALGAEYRPNDNFTVFLSPIAARFIVADAVHTSLHPDGAFGIDSAETFAFQFGAYLSTRYSVAITNTIDYRTRVDLYSNYLEDPQNVDVLWDNNISFKFSKYLGGNLGVTMVYDNDVTGQRDENGDLGPLGWTQLKQVLNLGLQWKFPEKKKEEGEK